MERMDKASSDLKTLSQTILIEFFYLVSWADGHISPMEVKMGKAMAQREGVGENFYRLHLENIRSCRKQEIMERTIVGLKRLQREEQINILAWVSLIANSDGFMDVSEWSLIYRIYHDELKLELKDVISRQSELYRLIAKKGPFSRPDTVGFIK
jgi:uncharacterized tellurite resistance protein B-like protein